MGEREDDPIGAPHRHDRDGLQDGAWAMFEGFLAGASILAHHPLHTVACVQLVLGAFVRRGAGEAGEEWLRQLVTGPEVDLELEARVREVFDAKMERIRLGKDDA